MEQTQQNSGEPLEPQQAAAKAALLAECARLAAAGITFVAVHFDGYGDDGTIPNRVGPSCMYHASLYDDMHDCGVGNQGTYKSMGRSVELTRSGRHNVSLRCECCPDLSRCSQDPGSSIRNRRRKRRVAQLFQARAGIVPELAL